jgi:PrtD family type I secretion system ABC transporter
MHKDASVKGGAASPVPAALVGVAVASMTVNLLALTGPLFMLQIYDRVLPSGSVATLVALGAVVLVLYGFFTALDATRARMLTRIGQHLVTVLAPRAFDGAMSVALHMTKRPRPHPIRDLDQVRQFLSGSGPIAIFDLPWLPLYLAVVFLFHPALGWVATGGALVMVCLMVAADLLAAGPTAAAQTLGAARSDLAHAATDSAEAAAAMGFDQALRQRWIDESDRYLDVQRRGGDRASAFGAAIKGWRFLLQSVILGAGALLAIIGEISPGIMIAASIVSARALAPVEQAITHWRGFVAARASWQSLRSAIAAVPAARAITPLPQPSHRLEVTALAVAPPGLRAPIVHDLSFALDAGDALGVIGPSGSGKSTLARALVGAWPPLRGSIRLDGADLDQWRREDRGRFIGYVPQDVQLIEGTVAENIARFQRDAPAEAVVEAARLANAYDLVTGLPKGFDTEVGASGMALSAGQRQRIALARAFYGRPFLIVLDEPNANLDNMGEEALAAAVRAMRERGSIVIVVAHRPSTLAIVNKILVVRDGMQTGFGPKEGVLPAFVVQRPAANNQKAVAGV